MRMKRRETLFLLELRLKRIISLIMDPRCKMNWRTRMDFLIEQIIKTLKGQTLQDSNKFKEEALQS